MKTKLMTLLAAASFSASLIAAPLTFDFKDPKGVNNVTFKLDAPLESITGSASGVSGSVEFDPEKPEATKGTIEVATETMHVGNPMMQGHLHSDKWMDVAKFPKITFETVSLANVKTTGTVTTADVTGKMTMKGITKEITVPAKFTYLVDKLSARIPNLQGDILVLRSDFSVKRSEFGIQPGKNEDKVSETIALSLSVSGMAVKK